MNSHRIPITFFFVVATVLSAGSIAQAQTDTPPFVGEVRPQSVDSNSSYWIVSSRLTNDRNGPARCCRLRYIKANLGADACNQCPLPPTYRVSDKGGLKSELVPGVPVCILVHGSYVRWNKALQAGLSGYRWIRSASPGQPLHVIVYTWRSDPITGVQGLDMPKLGRRSTWSGFYLSQLLKSIPESSPVTLIGHSHGVRSIASLIHLQGGGSVDGMYLPPHMRSPHRLRGVFTAAAIDHHDFNPNGRYSKAVYRADKIVNLRNPRDWALAFYHLLPGQTHALARVGLTYEDRAVLGAWAHKMEEFDVSTLIGDDHGWKGFTSNRDLAAVIAPTIHWTDAPAGPFFIESSVPPAPR